MNFSVNNSEIAATLSKVNASKTSLLLAITEHVFPKTSFPFLPIATTSTFLPTYESANTFTCLITLVLKAPHKPLLEVMATINTFFTSRCVVNSPPISPSIEALKLCRISVNFSA